MTQFPAFCPDCGLIFESSIQIAESRNVTFKNVGEACPRCGSVAELPDGTFNVVDETIEVLTASALSRKRLEGLSAVLDEARQGKRTSESAVEAVREASSTLGSLIDRLSPRMQPALIVFLWFVLQMLIQQGISELRDDSATREDVRSSVEKALKEIQVADRKP